LPKQRVGRPEKPNRFLHVNVLEWYHPPGSVRQQKKREKVGHPPNDATYFAGHSQFDYSARQCYIRNARATCGDSGGCWHIFSSFACRCQLRGGPEGRLTLGEPDK